MSDQLIEWMQKIDRQVTNEKVVLDLKNRFKITSRPQYLLLDVSIEMLKPSSCQCLDLLQMFRFLVENCQIKI